MFVKLFYVLSGRSYPGRTKTTLAFCGCKK